MMQIWKNKVGFVAAVASLLLTSPVVAGSNNDCCNPCDDCCVGDFSVGVEFLLWKPCVDDLAYAAQRVSEDPLAFQFQCVKPEWEPGFRVSLGYTGCDSCLTFLGQYTYVHHKSTDTAGVEGADTVVGVLAHPGFDPQNDYDSGAGAWQGNYHEWFLGVGTSTSCFECGTLFPYFGVAGVGIDQKFGVFISDETAELSEGTAWNSDLWGVGFRAGSRFEYEICGGFGFYTKAHGSILAGKADSKIAFDDDDANTDFNVVFKDCEGCQIIPGFDLAAGFVYEGCACNVDYLISVGYEFLYWHNVPNPRTFVGSDIGGNGSEIAYSTSSNTRTYGYHGLTIGLGLKF